MVLQFSGITFDKVLFMPVMLLLMLCSLYSTGQAVVFKNATEAIQTAQNNNQYLFLLFYDKKDDQTQAMESSAKNFKTGTAKNVLFHSVRTTDEKEISTVNKYGVSRAPLPVLLVFAPNGAVTAGFTRKVTDKDLKTSIVSGLVMKTLKTVQEGKIALVLFQNGNTKFNDESSKAARGFAQDARLSGKVDIIMADPAASENVVFLKNAGVSNDIAESTVMIIVPPGSIAGVYSGNVSKDALISGLAACSSGGCGSASSCGSGGCGPRK